jgi:hypothetical protein
LELAAEEKFAARGKWKIGSSCLAVLQETAPAEIRLAALAK